MRYEGARTGRTMHHHHEHGAFDYHDVDDEGGWIGDHDHAGHHHHGDDSTLYHQHDAAIDHDHHIAHHDAWLYDNDATYIFGPADHNHDKPAEHVHDWQPNDDSNRFDYRCACGTYSRGFTVDLVGVYRFGTLDPADSFAAS